MTDIDNNMTDAQAAQGLQGRRGCAGAQGADGSRGVQGLQGRSGITGLQGSRGCAGAQGSTGASGVQGLQGRRGADGLDGARGAQGLDGVQGAQGSKGATGRRGTMGYQGDSGAVGIQGLQGEDGAIWDDGIRLSGYNTHLFSYDKERGTFVPYGSDVLRVGDGARLSLWIDGEAYAALSDGGSVLRVVCEVNGVESVDEAPALYAGGTTLADVIDGDRDIDTIVELTRKGGEWYYSGGLLTPAVKEDITVRGLSVGMLSDGDVVKAGTTVQELAEMLLVREIDVDRITPRLSVRFGGGLSNGVTLEVGTQLTVSLESDITDGRFVGGEGYEYSISAGCPFGTVSYYADGREMDGSSLHVPSLGEVEHGFWGSVWYGDSTAEPVTNTGRVSDVKILSSNTKSGVITLNGRYMMYYGSQDAVTESNIDQPETLRFTDRASLSQLSRGWLPKDGDAVIPTIATTDDKPSFVLAVPDGWSVASTRNTMGQEVDVETTWRIRNTFEYTNGGASTLYRVYISPSTEACAYKDIVLRRGNG